MENVLFKIQLPGGIPRADRGRSAMTLHPQLMRGPHRATSRKITIRTHESAIRIIDKKGPLDNPADRDHCIQYMVAVPLIFGRLTAADYEDAVAADPRIDALRDKIDVRRGPAVHQGLPRPGQALDRQRAHGRVQRRHASSTEVVVEYPIGHRRRREEGMPVLVEKFRTNLARRFPAKQQQAILDVALDPQRARGDAGPRVRRPVASSEDAGSTESTCQETLMRTHFRRSCLARRLRCALRLRSAIAQDVSEAQARPVGAHAHVRPRRRKGTPIARCASTQTVQNEMRDMGVGAMQGHVQQDRRPHRRRQRQRRVRLQLRRSTMHSKSVMTFTGDTAYHTESRHDVRSAAERHGEGPARRSRRKYSAPASRAAARRRP